MAQRTATCKQCENPFPVPGGRGRPPNYCAGCHSEPCDVEGSWAGYMRHVKADEPPCLPCAAEARRIGKSRKRRNTKSYRCEECGATWCNVGSGRHKYCSDHCFNAAKVRHLAQRERPSVALDCSFCGQRFTRVAKDVSPGANNFCSQECYWAFAPFKGSPASDIPWAVCLRCRVWFVARRARRLCPTCPSPSYRDYVPSRPPDSFCVVCGKRLRNKTCPRLYCSKACQRKTPQYRQGQKAARRRRRARKRKAQRVETVDALVVYRRDKWVCQLCGEKLDREAKVPDSLAPTVDHIVPLARGGDHTYANTQAAHFICNAKKGDRPLPDGEQLRLVG